MRPETKNSKKEGFVEQAGCEVIGESEQRFEFSGWGKGDGKMGMVVAYIRVESNFTHIFWVNNEKNYNNWYFRADII